MFSLSRILPSLIEFLSEVKTEVKRVNWPSRQETIRDTIVVILFAIIVATLLSVFDFGLQWILNTLLL